MATSRLDPPSAGSLELETTVRELRHETIVFTVPALGFAGLLLIVTAHLFTNRPHAAVPGVLFYLLALAVWLLRRRFYHASAWTLIVGCAGIDFLFVVWADVPVAVCLLAVPAGLAALFVGSAGGAAMSAVLTAWLVVAPSSMLPAEPGLRVVAAVAIWSAVGLNLLSLRPLLTALQWSWSSHKRSHVLLEQTRDYQVQLNQTLHDLAEANVQLTRLNRLAQGLRREAEDARRTKEQFVANVSHELRTPLNMIIGFCQMIVQAPHAYGRNIPPALLADLAIVLRNSQHLSSLINDVLDLSQIEVGHMALTRERTSLREVVEAAVIAARPLFDSKALYLESEIAEDLPLVYCDPTRIREVVLNLLSNAGRFTERGGVRVKVWREGGDVVASVEDTGPGIREEDKERLFLPFHQLDASFRRRHGGSGLGLSISKSFVEMHGGQMWFESKPGAGARFCFRLPIEPSKAADAVTTRWATPHERYEQRTRRSRTPLAIVNPRLVVLEQTGSLTHLLRRYMDGTEIVPVSSLEEACQDLADVPALALVTNAPSVGEALQQLRSTPLPYGTPAIVCSVPASNAAASSLGIDDYLVKPILPDRLLASLDKLHLKGGTVLVVDDEPDIIRLIQRTLGTRGRRYRVLSATDGEQALSILRGQRPDVILLDLVMPGMDGFTLLEMRSQESALRDIPIVVISARDPAGQPIVSDAVAVTRSGGLSTHQLLTCIEAISIALGTAGQTAEPASKAEHHD